jgi:transcriptional regulator with XRE-family HTH domain
MILTIDSLLKQIRDSVKARSISLDELAEHTGIHRNTLLRFSTNKEIRGKPWEPSVDTIRRLERFFATPANGQKQAASGLSGSAGSPLGSEI